MEERLENALIDLEAVEKELLQYKEENATLREDVEDLELEVETLKICTNKNEQSRRMSILITENETLYQANHQLGTMIRTMEEDESRQPDFDVEKLKLVREKQDVVKNLEESTVKLKQMEAKEKIMKEQMRQTEKDLSTLKDKVCDITDMLTTSENKLEETMKEKAKMKKDVMAARVEMNKKLNAMKTKNIDQEAQFDELMTRFQELKQKSGLEVQKLQVDKTNMEADQAELTGLISAAVSALEPELNILVEESQKQKLDDYINKLKSGSKKLTNGNS